MNNVDISIMFWADKHHLDSDKEYSETVIFVVVCPKTGEKTVTTQNQRIVSSLTPSRFIAVPVSSKESGRACISVFLSLSAIFLLDFENVPVTWYFCFPILLKPSPKAHLRF